MTEPVYVSPCCGATCRVGGSTNRIGAEGATHYMVCSSCGQPCDPMDADLRMRIVAEGMRRATHIADQHDCRGEHDYGGCADGIAAAIRREADALVANRRQSAISGNGSPQGGATDGRRQP